MRPHEIVMHEKDGKVIELRMDFDGTVILRSTLEDPSDEDAPREAEAMYIWLTVDEQAWLAKQLGWEAK